MIQVFFYIFLILHDDLGRDGDRCHRWLWFARFFSDALFSFFYFFVRGKLLGHARLRIFYGNFPLIFFSRRQPSRRFFLIFLSFFLVLELLFHGFLAFRCRRG